MTLQSQMVLYMRLINLEAAKQICQAKLQCSMFRGMVCSLCYYMDNTIVLKIGYNDIFKVLKFSCSDRECQVSKEA